MLSEYYHNKLKSLNVDRSSGHPKPHKVCLLLSILDLIEAGKLVENKIVITESLKNAFHENFNRLKKGNDAEKLDLPFYHLRGDGIWHFAIKSQEEFEALVSMPGTPSLGRLLEVIDYAYLDPDLYDFFNSSLARPLIRQALLENLEDLSEQFYRWLLELGKSERTAKSYVGAIRGSVSQWAADAGISDQNLISITGHSSVDRVKEELATYDVFLEADRRGKSMYSSALKSYLNFLDITYQAEVSEDIEDILKDVSIEETQRMTYVNARIGQGRFRNELIEYWDQCAVTGYSGKGFLVASHIKPWKVSNSLERLDKFNGLLLLANIDKAFDLGFVTFNTDGGIVISEFIEKPDVLGIHGDMMVNLAEQHQEYMDYHRTRVYESKIQ